MLFSLHVNLPTDSSWGAFSLSSPYIQVWTVFPAAALGLGSNRMEQPPAGLRTHRGGSPAHPDPLKEEEKL